jgi:phytoene dehydrogenase-like protein
VLSSRSDSDVIVIGGGPAGLAAAHHLTAAGLAVTVLEAARRIGGRMATDHFQGFRLDRASHLSLAGTPVLSRLPAPLPLRPLTGGVLLHGPAGRVHRLGESEAAGVPALTAAFDRLRLGAGLARLGRLPEAGGDAALPARIVEGALRPLLAALLHDPDPAADGRPGDAALRAFARPGLSLPAGGAAVLPELLAAALPPGTIRTGVRAESVSTTAVTTRDHGTFRCRAVVLATGAAEAARLLPGLRVPAFHPVTVLHHATSTPVAAGPALLVDTTARGPVSYTLAASAADPSRAPAGRTLVTSVVAGSPAAEPTGALDKAARPQLGELYGTPADDWELLAVRHDPQAVPVAAGAAGGPRTARLLDGLYICGDHRDTPGLTGDLASAYRAALSLLSDAGVAPVPQPRGAASAPAPA